MSRADSGGFDLGLHLALDAFTDQINDALNAVKPQVPAECTFWIPLLHKSLVDQLVTIHTDFKVDDITVGPDSKGVLAITLSCSTTGTSVTWPSATYGLLNEEVAGVENYPLACRLSITANLERKDTQTGTRLVGLTFPDNAVTVTIDKGTDGVLGTLEQITPIQTWLSYIDLLTAPLELVDWVADFITIGLNWLEHSRARLYDDFCRRIAGKVTAVLDKLPDPFLPLGVIPGIVGDLKFDSADEHELRVLVTMEGGETGSAREITRSPIRRTSQGEAMDIAAVVIGNHYLLRNVVKPILTLGLGLADAGFEGDHPCHWWGAKQLMPQTAKVQDMVPAITAVHAGIVAGMVTVTMDFSAAHATGAYGLNGAMRVDFAVPNPQPGGPTGRVLQLTPPVCTITGIDVWIAWWAYLVPILTAPVAALILALHDALAGSALRGTITNAIDGVLGPIKKPLELPVPKLPIEPPAPSFSQGGPPHTWIARHHPALPQGTNFPMVDPEPETDVIVRFPSPAFS